MARQDFRKPHECSHRKAGPPAHGQRAQRRVAREVEHAQREAGELFPLPKMMVFCAFAFDPEAAKDIDALKGITALKAQMNTDLLTEDLKKASSKSTTNQSFLADGPARCGAKRAAQRFVAGRGEWL